MRAVCFRYLFVQSVQFDSCGFVSMILHLSSTVDLCGSQMRCWTSFFHWYYLSALLFSSPDQREKERDTRLQELRHQKEERAQKGRGAGAGETVMRKVEKSADGSSLSQITKTDRFTHSGSCFIQG